MPHIIDVIPAILLFGFLSLSDGFSRLLICFFEDLEKVKIAPSALFDREELTLSVIILAWSWLAASIILLTAFWALAGTQGQV